MLVVLLIIAAIVLMLPYPLKKVMRYGWPLILIILSASMLITLSDYQHKSMITVTATTEQNPLAEGSEIWIVDVVVDGVSHNPREVFKKGWSDRENHVIWDNKMSNSNKSITAMVPKDSDTQIVFMANKWRGIATVKGSKETVTIDTYNPNDEFDKTVSVSPDTAGLKLTYVYYVTYAALGIGIIGFLIIVLRKRKKQ